MNDKIPLASVIGRLTIVRQVGDQDNKISYRIPEKEKLKTEMHLKKLKEGFKINAYEKGTGAIGKTMMEVDDDNKPSKRKRSEKQANLKQKAKKRKLEPKIVKTKQIEDKSNPNRKLKPNADVLVWSKDPLFEQNDEVPFVSSIAQSRLAIRAVLTNNLKLLEKCKKDTKQVHSIHTIR